jgi:hypothetical protein
MYRRQTEQDWQNPMFRGKGNMNMFKVATNFRLQVSATCTTRMSHAERRECHRSHGQLLRASRDTEELHVRYICYSSSCTSDEFLSTTCWILLTSSAYAQRYQLAFWILLLRFNGHIYIYIYIYIKFVAHRKHITSPLQTQFGKTVAVYCEIHIEHKPCRQIYINSVVSHRKCVTSSSSSSSISSSSSSNNSFLFILVIVKNKTRGLSPWANYTDRETAACRRS